MSTVPIDDKTGFDRDASIKAKFSEPMLRRSITNNTFRLYVGTYTDEDLNPQSAHQKTQTASLKTRQRLSHSSR